LEIDFSASNLRKYNRDVLGDYHAGATELDPVYGRQSTLAE
jgi:hypothetical protein